MRNIFRTLTLVGALGALAPVAAHADVGLHMYQPSPLIIHAHHQHRTAALNTQAKTHNADQAHANQRNG